MAPMDEEDLHGTFRPGFSLGHYGQLNAEIDPSRVEWLGQPSVTGSPTTETTTGDRTDAGNRASCQSARTAR